VKGGEAEAFAVLDQLKVIKLAVMGLPVPAVWGVQEVGGRWGIVFDRISEVSFAKRMQEDPRLVPECLEILVRLHARINTHPAHELGSLKLRLAANIARTSLLDEPRKQILLSLLAEMPRGDRLCHGDFHPINVLGQTSQPLVIDWPDACRGDPSADVCTAACTNISRATIVGWLPYVAAARLAEGVPNDFERLLEIVNS
jgi:aminoglycoside phosphotransferase (APT) family kinase protein